MTKINFSGRKEHIGAREEFPLPEARDRATAEGTDGTDPEYADCSATARQGTFAWQEKFREAAKPVFEELYDQAHGNIASCIQPDYREKLEKELWAPDTFHSGK